MGNHYSRFDPLIAKNFISLLTQRPCKSWETLMKAGVLCARCPVCPSQQAWSF